MNKHLQFFNIAFAASLPFYFAAFKWFDYQRTIVVYTILWLLLAFAVWLHYHLTK